MSYALDETSVYNAQPIELYLFTYNGQAFTYTSSQYSQPMTVEGTRYVFSPDYIKRGQSLKLGDSGGTVETCTITVLRTNSIALLYQGAPPEQDSVRVQIFRVHGENNDEYIKILDGIVSQVIFRDSEAELTITIENILNRNIPRGAISYFCQNCIFDTKCRLDKSKYAMTCYIDGGIDGLTISSTNLLTKPSGYYTDGFIKIGNALRAVVQHKDRFITIKYPLSPADKEGSFVIYPGCNGLFSVCHRKFGNTDNFNAIPYQQPYDAVKHPTGGGVYWVNGNIVYRDTKGAIYVPRL